MGAAAQRIPRRLASNPVAQDVPEGKGPGEHGGQRVEKNRKLAAWGEVGRCSLARRVRKKERAGGDVAEDREAGGGADASRGESVMHCAKLAGKWLAWR